MKAVRKVAGIAVLFSTVAFLGLGIVTDLIPNRFFLRMVPPNPVDYLFLTLTSVLLGTYISFHMHLKRRASTACTLTAGTGGVGGFLGFGCALCDKLLVLLLGVAGVLTFIEPYKPLFGTIGVLMLGYAVYRSGKALFSGDS